MSTNTQINVRMPDSLLKSAKNYAASHGFGTVQEFIKDTVREKIFEEPELSKKEYELVKKFIAVTEKGKHYSTEKELFKRLNK